MMLRKQSVVHTTQVRTIFRLDGDALTGVDEQRHLHHQTGGHRGALVHVVRGVTLHPLGSFCHFHGDSGGQLDGAHDFIGEEQYISLALDEVILNGLNDVLTHAHVLVGLRVEEVVTHTVHIGEFHLLTAEHHTLQEVVGGEAQVVILLGSNAADGHLHIGSHAGGSLELALTHNADIAVVVHGVTLAELNNGNFCHSARRLTEPCTLVKLFLT